MPEPLLNPVADATNSTGDLTNYNTIRPSLNELSNRTITVPVSAQMAEPDRDCRAQPQPQRASRLLSLPTELRLIICGYMTLSPASADSLAWKGAYFACRQLHDDMRNELKPEEDLSKFIATNQTLWTNTDHQWSITIGLPHPQLDLIRDVKIHAPITWCLRGTCSLDTVSSLYTLYLNHLHIILVGRDQRRFPSDGLKSWHPPLFMNRVRNGKVHCKKITFTIDGLANVKDGREKSTQIANMVPDTKILYLLEIVQDKAGRQTERVYSSDVRFKPLPLRN